MTSELAKVAFGVLGNITAAFLFLSPLPTFWRIFWNRQVEDFSGVPYLTAALNCSLWTFYGLPVINFQMLVVTVNAAGACLEIFYITVYILFSEGKPRVWTVYVLTLANRLNASTTRAADILHPTPMTENLSVFSSRQKLMHTVLRPWKKIKVPMFIYGLCVERQELKLKVVKLFIAMAFGFILMAGLVVGVEHDLNTRTITRIGYSRGSMRYFGNNNKTIMQTKSVEFMPFLLSLFIFLNSSAWTVYSFLPPKDFYIAVPNIMGLVLETGQLILYTMYHKSTPRTPFLAPANKLALERASEKIAPILDSSSPEGSHVMKKLTAAPNNV